MTEGNNQVKIADIMITCGTAPGSGGLVRLTASTVAVSGKPLIRKKMQ